MNTNNFSRRQFLQSALCSGLLYGTGALPSVISSASALPAPLQNRLLVNLNLSGGPDLRHLIVPAYDSTPDSFGAKYWKHRDRAHQLASTGVTAQQRWEQDYYPITVGGQGWSSGMVDPGNLNGGTTFGIWREAGWLIDMVRSGNGALIFNAVGGTNRAHDLSSLMLSQGNVLSELNDRDRSGWGGRVARSAGGNSISLTSTPSSFCFGPKGLAPNYNPNAIDNFDLISVEDSRDIGLFDFNIESNQFYDFDDKMARAAKSYYAGLRQERVASVYQKFMDHEAKVREFGELIQGRLVTVPIPDVVQALYSNINGINIDPNDSGSTGRRVLRQRHLGYQIRNLYDIVAANDLLTPSVMSMSYGSWDSHGNQRQVPSILASDPHNPDVGRGIENGLKDIFGGQYGNNPSDASAFHSGFSALYASLPQADRNKIVITIAGEFGRQIRDNGDAGTDHGKGNLMLVLGEGVRGGVYGEMFPDDEVDKYDNTSLRTPDIDPRSEIDTFFSKVSDWVAPGSANAVFPRMASSYAGEAPLLELPGLFDNLMS
ncbi:DUF1501 domain-containing protein [Arenicella xantha]|uniref:Uncharacterized protein DUF1501 n=1 Tax=Arenicella xantha TaxID=644221 RepID=A0A395JQV0_9GAMM|nr:DUF1501 domain-containing protein [Arenicella xantha]RBP53743.1 uncharacterized protein DUF1501 [Arenicella xantha]